MKIPSLFISSRLLVGLFTLCLLSCNTETDKGLDQQISTELLVIGGGTSGVSSALQAARMGVKVTVIESTSWLGGMLTAAGVSATDGNHQLPSGIWGEFRDAIYNHYGGPGAVATGWVSNTHFEPQVGDSIWKTMLNEEPNITVFYQYKLDTIIWDGESVNGAKFTSLHESASTLEVKAQVIIDATELGDVIGMAGLETRIGQDSKLDTEEALAPLEASPHIQDLTYVAILKDYGPDNPYLIDKPQSYDPAEFDCLCKELCDAPEVNVVDCETMLNYAKLPNGYYLINWPNNGNDYYVNAIPLSYAEREKAYQDAKQRTLNWIYHIQSKGGYKNLGVADDIFPTKDGLALIPYHRESRRIKAQTFFTVDDIRYPYQNEKYKEAIAVGDYPIDHHHKKNPDASNEFTPETEFPVPSYSVPLGSLIPEDFNGIIAAEKSIGVSHLANGTTRLQPVVLGIGQAAGALAALSISKQVTADAVPIREVQNALLESNAWLMPFIDTKPGDSFFIPLQKMGVTGLLRGNGVPYQWANQTWIYPDTAVTMSELRHITSAIPEMVEMTDSSRFELIRSLSGKKIEELDDEWAAKLKELSWWRDGQAVDSTAIRRKELARILDQQLDLFDLGL